MELKINGHTLDFIKMCAKKIKKDKSIKHTEALEIAAVDAGFKNYKDCINQFNK